MDIKHIMSLSVWRRVLSPQNKHGLCKSRCCISTTNILVHILFFTFCYWCIVGVFYLLLYIHGKYSPLPLPNTDAVINCTNLTDYLFSPNNIFESSLIMSGFLTTMLIISVITMYICQYCYQSIKDIYVHNEILLSELKENTVI